MIGGVTPPGMFGTERAGESQRDSGPKLRVARNELPWENGVGKGDLPRRGCGEAGICHW